MLLLDFLLLVISAYRNDVIAYILCLDMILHLVQHLGDNCLHLEQPVFDHIELLCALFNLLSIFEQLYKTLRAIVGLEVLSSFKVSFVDSVTHNAV